MKFETTDSLHAFLRDEPFYISKDCFCLGNTLDDAGIITRCIMESAGERISGEYSSKREVTGHVGMDSE